MRWWVAGIGIVVLATGCAQPEESSPPSPAASATTSASPTPPPSPPGTPTVLAGIGAATVDRRATELPDQVAEDRFTTALDPALADQVRNAVAALRAEQLLPVASVVHVGCLAPARVVLAERAGQGWEFTVSRSKDEATVQCVVAHVFVAVAGVRS